MDWHRRASFRMSRWNRSHCGRRNSNVRHGLTYSPTWYSWIAARRRCSDPLQANFEYYGGAKPAIRSCRRWSGPRGFEHFVQDMGLRPRGTMLGRIGDVGNYVPGRCRWMTREQSGAERRKKFALRKSENE